MTPIIALLIIGATVATGVLVIAARSLNKNAVVMEQSLALTALSTQRVALENLAFDYTWWDEISENIVDRYDPKWADGNIGSYLTDAYAINHAFVIDETGRTRAAFLDGEPDLEFDALGYLPYDVDLLIARAQEASYAFPVAHSGIALLDGRPHLVAVCAITPEELPDPVPERTKRPVLVLAKHLDEVLLSELAESYLLDKLRFVREDEPAGTTSLELRSVNGSLAGRLEWRSVEPGTAFVDQYWPALVGTFVCMMLLTIIFLRRADRNWWDVMQLRVRLTDEMHARRHDAGIAHMQRLNVVGEMATTLAHELNQPLTSISSYAQGCVNRLRPGEPVSPDIVEAMKQIVGQAERADAIIRRIREFVRRDSVEPVPTNINTLLQETAILLHSDLRDGDTHVDWQLDEDLPKVMINPVQLQQVFVNLIQNAIDAMGQVDPSNRRLKVSTRDLGVGEIEVTLVDNGHGFTADALEHAFDPFFTTKGSGMGMGLAISRSIVEAHHGDLTIASAPDGGAVFRMTLPIRGEKNEPG